MFKFNQFMYDFINFKWNVIKINNIYIYMHKFIVGQSYNFQILNIKK